MHLFYILFDPPVELLDKRA